MTAVSVNTYTHSVTYVADNILKSMKDIIRLSGMDPSGFVGNWEVNRLGLATWLASGDLDRVILEVFDPRTDALIGRWDMDIVYGYGSGDGGFWVDTDQIRYAIKKVGTVPAAARYRLLVTTKLFAPAVAGWGTGAFRSTAGMSRQSLGSTIDHSGLGANSAYWRRS